MCISYAQDTDNLRESAVPKVAKQGVVVWPDDGMHRQNDLSPLAVVSYLRDKRVMIAHVRNGTHFVLVTGYEMSERDLLLYVNDPGFDETTYTYSGVVGYRIFDIKHPPKDMNFG